MKAMKIIQAPRASAILYNLLTSQKQTYPWLLPANICPIVPATFMKASVPFELVDISGKSLHMDLDQAEARVKKRRYGGLLYAHTYGDESTPEDFFALVKSLHPDILLVDDRCLCIPKFEAESSADIVVFSTGYAKIVQLDFGGYSLANEGVEYQSRQMPFNPDSLAELEKMYKSAVQNKTKFQNLDTDWLQTDGFLPVWDEYRRQIESGIESSLAQRSRLNSIYKSYLPEEIQLPPEYQNWRFNIRVNNQADVLKMIFQQGLFASSHYASLAGIISNDSAPQAERLASEVINLFNDHYFDEDRAIKISRVIVDNLS